MPDTRETVKNFIESSFLPGSAVAAIENGTSFLEIGLMDSTGVLEMVDFLEEQFGITVEDEELVPDNLDSIDKICRYLESKGCAADSG